MTDLSELCGRCGQTYGAHHDQSCPTGVGEFQPTGCNWNSDTAKVEGVRSFDTGATRSSDVGRYDPEGFLSPLAIERYCIYMQKNQVQPDGSIRTSDNWQKGIPQDAYMKGLLRHVLHLWCRHRGHPVADPKAAADKVEDLCALLFNVQGMLHELLKTHEAMRGSAK